MTDHDFDTDDAPTADDDAVEAVLALGGLDLFPADTRAAVEAVLLAGQALEPQTRARVVDAARRGSRARFAGRRPVETLLYDARRAAQRNLEDIAAAVVADPKLLDAVERGSRRITEVPAEVTARWVEEVGIDAGTAVAALTTSLVPAGGGPRPYGSRRGDAQLDASDAEYISSVRTALGLPKQERA